MLVRVNSCGYSNRPRVSEISDDVHTTVMSAPGLAPSDMSTVTSERPLALLVLIDGGSMNAGALSLTSSTRTVIVVVAVSC